MHNVAAWLRQSMWFDILRRPFVSPANNYMSTAREIIRLATDIATVPQKELAAEVGVSALTLSHWRSGRRNPTARNLMELGRVLLEHSRSLERSAHELMRLAQKNEIRHAVVPTTSPDTATLELFPGESEAV